MFKKLATTALAITGIVLAVYFLYFTIGAFVGASATAKIGVITATVSVAAFIYNNQRQHTRDILARQFSQKRDAYQKFFDLMFDIFTAQKAGLDAPEDITLAKMQGIVKDVMIWGSADTINEYNSFVRSSMITREEGDLGLFVAVESLIRSVRADLGHNDRNLEKFGISKLLLKAEEHHKFDR